MLFQHRAILFIDIFLFYLTSLWKSQWSLSVVSEEEWVVFVLLNLEFCLVKFGIISKPDFSPHLIFNFLSFSIYLFVNFNNYHELSSFFPLSSFLYLFLFLFDEHVFFHS